MENIEYIDNIVNKKEIQIILKELINKDGKLYDKIIIFEKNGKFDYNFFERFLIWLDNGLKNEGNFIINYNSKEINKDEFIENIGDFLDMELIKKENKSKNSKKIVIEGVKEFIINKIENFEIQQELFKILNI